MDVVCHRILPGSDLSFSDVKQACSLLFRISCFISPKCYDADSGQCCTAETSSTRLVLVQRMISEKQILGCDPGLNNDNRASRPKSPNLTVLRRHMIPACCCPHVAHIRNSPISLLLMETGSQCILSLLYWFLEYLILASVGVTRFPELAPRS